MRQGESTPGASRQGEPDGKPQGGCSKVERTGGTWRIPGGTAGELYINYVRAPMQTTHHTAIISSHPTSLCIVLAMTVMF